MRWNEVQAEDKKNPKEKEKERPKPLSKPGDETVEVTSKPVWLGGR